MCSSHEVAEESCMDPGPGGQKRQKKRLRPNNRPTVRTHTPPMPAAPHPGLEPPNVSSCMSACRWFLGSWKRLGGGAGCGAVWHDSSHKYVHTYICMHVCRCMDCIICVYIHTSDMHNTGTGICTFSHLHRLLQRYDKMSNICNLI